MMVPSLVVFFTVSSDGTARTWFTLPDEIDETTQASPSLLATHEGGPVTAMAYVGGRTMKDLILGVGQDEENPFLLVTGAQDGTAKAWHIADRKCTQVRKKLHDEGTLMNLVQWSPLIRAASVPQKPALITGLPLYPDFTVYSIESYMYEEEILESRLICHLTLGSFFNQSCVKKGL